MAGDADRLESGRRWLITGGCGFIGRHVVAELCRRDVERVVVLDDLSVGTRDDLDRAVPPGDLGDDASARVQLVVGDIRDEATCRKVAEGMDVVVHLAAQTGVPVSVESPLVDCELNVVGLLNVLEASRQAETKRFIFASSGAPAGDAQPPISETTLPKPRSPYGASKLAGEAYCRVYHATFGLETIALRFGNVYGPLSGHKTSVVAKFIRQALAGESLEIYGDGSQTRDYIYVCDLVEAILAAATVPGIGGELFQVATGAETDVGTLAEWLADALETAGITRPRIDHAAERLGDVQRSVADTSKSLDVLGWSARTGLKDGLEATVKCALESASAATNTPGAIDSGG